MRGFIYILFFIVGSSGYSQFTLTGTVVDENGLPLHGSHIHSNYYNTITDASGKFEITQLPRTELRLYISFIGYESKDIVVDIHHDVDIKVQLFPEVSSLDEVVISQNGFTRHAISSQIVSESYIQEKFSGSLAKTLERLPGINATEIGAGASKPIIRGLGFNRVVVAENGIKHEGQQWGADHGLEIDAFSAEEIEVIKSGGIIEYGSDAIGGVINIRNDIIPEKGSFTGEYTLFGRSVNQTLSNSLNIQSRKDKFFFKFKATVSDYGDYNVPTDNIVYLSTNLPVFNNRLKNTAGYERNFLGQVGYVSERFQSILTTSNTYSKAGFFPGSHGVPSIARLQDDGDRRNIEFPFQNVNHFKITSTNKWFFDQSDLIFSVNLQNNRRQEHSEFHTHFGNQQPPEHNPDLELDYNLTTYDSQLKFIHYLSRRHKATFGLQAQLQNNDISGYAFLLPSYTRNSVGVFSTYEYLPNDKIIMSLGVRADYANLKTDSFFDPFLYDFLINRGETPEYANRFALRSTDINRDFNNINALGGIIYQPNPQWEYNFTFGTNFRIPTAIELAANGIHHGSFRHEQGNPSLDPEKGIATDFRVGYQKDDFNIGLSPFLYYFDNYIFLQPSGSFSPLPHGGQIYRYTQSEAMLTGIEFQVEKTFLDKISTNFVFEYIYNQQITGSRSRDFPLPFSPPANGFFEVEYLFNDFRELFLGTTIAANTRFALNQERTAQNEQVTPGYTIFGFGIKTTLAINKFKADIFLQGTNLLNTRYFNHTNFYRALEIPEMGRNIQLMIKIPFGETNG